MSDEPLPMSDEPLPGLRTLADADPPPWLVAAVMSRVAVPPPPSTLWQWFVRSRSLHLRVSPLAALVGMGVVVALSFGPAWRRPPGHRAALTSSSIAAEVVWVRFVLVAPGARQVALAGNWNAWSPTQILLDDTDGGGTFTATLPLPRGRHESMFVVDGAWVSDPAAVERHPDGFGQNNGVLRL